MTISRAGAVAAAAAIFATGAAAAYLWNARANAPKLSQQAQVAEAPAVGVAPAEGAIRISADVQKRAGITVEEVGSGVFASLIRVPAVVQPNAYRQVSVTPLAGGRVTRVFVELGQRVGRGAAIAEVYSPEAAEARTKYLNARAETEAGDARLRRTERLASLGSASQQELEQVRAEHVRHEAEMRGAASRLRLLGLDPARAGDPNNTDAGSTITVTAPQAGVIVQRPAIAGMTAEPSTAMATIADLSPVWIIADVFERDIRLVRAGADATVTTSAYPGREWHGRVTYISPELRPETRTAQVRVEVANPDSALKFGMFVNASVGGTRTASVTVPRGAVQMVGPDSVVFVSDDAANTTFHQRRVVLGASEGDRMAVVEGLSAGERIVASGSFVLRAEAERTTGATPGASRQDFEVAITEQGFEPAKLTLQRGVTARVTFTRKTDQTCATEVVLPAYGIRRALPLNQAVSVEFVPAAKDAMFQCGMGMLAGTIVVR